MATATRLTSNATTWSSPGTTQASSSISPGANCFLVAFVTATTDSSSGTEDQHPGSLVSSGSGPTWTSRADTNITTAFIAQGSVWTAAIGGSDPGSFTVTWTRAGTASVGARVITIWKITDYDTGTPYAGAIAVPSDTANGARNETLGATPASGDIVLVQAFSDDDDGNNVDITLSDTNRTWTSKHGSATTNAGCPWVTGQSTSSTSTAIDAADMNPGDAHDFSSVILAIIVKTAAGTNADAGHASGTGTANDVTSSVDRASAGHASATGTAYDATVSVSGAGTSVNAGLAEGFGAAIQPNRWPYVVASNVAALTTNDPAVTLTGYVPREGDLVILFVSSTTVLGAVANASLPAGWANPLGDGAEINSDAHGMACFYHLVTSAEEAAVTTTYTATDALDAAETGRVHGVAVRNVEQTDPIDGFNSAQNSGNTTTPHVLAGITGAGVLLDHSLVISSVASDGTETYSDPAGWTLLQTAGTTQGRWTGYRVARTAAGTDVTATNITPSAGNEYASITLAVRQPIISNAAGHASGTGAADTAAANVAPNAGTATATGTAYDVTVGGTSTNAPAGTATGSGVAENATVNVQPNAGTATATGAADTASVNVAPNAGTATATGTAYDATASTAAFTNAPAGLATGTATVSRSSGLSSDKPFIKAVSGRRLVDHFGNDILLRCWSSWGLAQNLANADITTHLEGVQARGFNAVNVMMFGYDVAVDWDPYVAGNGSAVFTGTPYQSSLGAGWGSMDQVVSESERLGLTVVMSLYTAFGTTGPRADMEAASNANMTSFGEAVATRYLDYENIVWHVGMDDTTGATIEDRINAFFTGVNNVEGATRRTVRLCEPANGSTGFSQFGDWYAGTGDVDLTVNSLYDYTDDAVVNADAVHGETGATTIPWWDCEPPYRWAGHYGDTTTIEPQEIRERIYSVIFRGGVGLNVGNEDSWPFGLTGLFSGGRTWQQTLTDPDAFWAEYAWTLFGTVGNTSGFTRDAATFLTTGTGTGDTKAASCYSGSQALVYFPSSRTIVVDTTILTGTSNVRLRWYDPTDGTYDVIAASEAQNASRSITHPGNNTGGFPDWVLVVDLLADTNAAAESASGTGTAYNASVNVAPNAGTATSSGLADTAAVNVAPNAGAVTATGVANDATVSTSSATNAPAEAAAATGTADASSVNVAPNAGTATATGTANNATVQTSAGTNALAEAAAGTGTAYNPSCTVTFTAGHATAAATAYDPAVGISPNAGTATGSTVGYDSPVLVAANAGLATATGVALDPEDQSFDPNPLTARPWREPAIRRWREPSIAGWREPPIRPWRP